MSATHCHSGGSVTGVFQTEPDKEYEHFLGLRLADAVLQAINNLAPARIGWASGSEPRHVFNRRWKMKPGVVNPDPFGGTNDRVRMNPTPGSPDLAGPAGLTDPEVSVLAVQSPSGRPIAVLANYSLHYCGDVPPHTFSADYFGMFRERLGQLLGADAQAQPFVAILSNGTSGDCNSIHFPEPPKPAGPSFTLCRRVANDVAEAARGAYQKIEFRDWVPLKTATREITLRVRRPSESEAEAARKKLAAEILPTSNREVIYARETVLLADYPTTVNLILQVFRVGDLGIAAVPCEPFAESGLELKEKSPLKPSFTIGLANGFYGYLPPPRHHALGGYETWRARTSFLETEAAPKIVSALIELFHQVQ